MIFQYVLTCLVLPHRSVPNHVSANVTPVPATGWRQDEMCMQGLKPGQHHPS